MLQYSSYFVSIQLAPGLITLLLLDPSPMRHSHPYGYSGLKIGGQVPGRISNEVMMRSFQNK